MCGKTEKQASVEELAKLFNCVYVPRRLCMKAMDCTRCLAESVLELGYQKVPQGYAVLPIHNPDAKTTWTKVPDELWWALHNTNQAIEDARKETATEILQRIKASFDSIKESNKDSSFEVSGTDMEERWLHGVVEAYGYFAEIGEIAKQYGVKL